MPRTRSRGADQVFLRDDHYDNYYIILLLLRMYGKINDVPGGDRKRQEHTGRVGDTL